MVNFAESCRELVDFHKSACKLVTDKDYKNRNSKHITVRLTRCTIQERIARAKDEVAFLRAIYGEGELYQIVGFTSVSSVESMQELSDEFNNRLDKISERIADLESGIKILEGVEQ